MGYSNEKNEIFHILGLGLSKETLYGRYLWYSMSGGRWGGQSWSCHLVLRQYRYIIHPHLSMRTRPYIWLRCISCMLGILWKWIGDPSVITDWTDLLYSKSCLALWTGTWILQPHVLIWNPTASWYIESEFHLLRWTMHELLQFYVSLTIVFWEWIRNNI